MSGGARADKVMDAILALLSLRADRAGIAAVSVADLAGSLSYSGRQVQRYLRTLEESGRLQPLSSSGGRGQATRWHITPKKGDISPQIGLEKGDISEAREDVTLSKASNPSAPAQNCTPCPAERMTFSQVPEGGQAPLFPPHPPIPPSKPSSSPSSEVDPAIAGAAAAADGDDDRSRNRNLPQNLFVQRVYAAYREVGAAEPPPSVVGQWARMVGQEALLTLLAELAGQGHLASKPQPYVHRAVANLAKGHERPANQPAGSDRRVAQAARLKAARTVRTPKGEGA